MLFKQKKISLAKASSLLGMPRIRFQRELASRQIPIHYDVEDFDADLRNLRAAGRL
jgi:predicted HTH domain antitoxin